MGFNADTPIRGPGTGKPDQIATWAAMHGAQRPADLLDYLRAVYAWAPPLGINPDVIAAQSHLETGGWSSDWWISRLNPAGIGITGDPIQNAASKTFDGGDEAAAAHVAHLGLYAGADVPDDLAVYDPRWKAAVDAGYTGIATTLADLNNRWAIDPDNAYGEKIAGRLNLMASAGLISTVEDAPMTAKLHVLLVAGHNSVGDRGNPVERSLTPNLAKAYLAAFKAEGISAEWLNPTLTAGGLDGLASLTARKIRDADADLVLALDLHFNGADSGVHVIPAHNKNAKGGMLSTAIVAGRVREDVMENNTLDVTFANAVARAIVTANPGMKLYYGTHGLMPESSTGVGADGYRLAMMAYSAPYRDKSIRVTIEHGGTNDAKREDFYNRCAGAAVSTVKTVLGTRIEQPSPAPDPGTPEPPEGDPGNPSLPAFLFGEAAGYSFDPDGPVSKLWLETGTTNDRWPRLVDVRIDGEVKYFVFSSGEVIVSEPGKGVAYLDVAA